MTHHGGKIVWLLGLAVAAACAPQSRLVGTNGADPLVALRAGPPLPADRVWTLERSGPSPSDTSVVFARRTGRHVIIRHGAPDNAVFIELDFPPDTSAAGSETLHLLIRPLPGRYGVALESANALPPGSTASFSYAMHFALPADAVGRYPTATRFDQSLSAARQTVDDRIQLITSNRPAIDIMQFPLTTAGTYLLVAPK